MNLSEKKLRIVGLLFITVFFFIFFMMEMFFSPWKIPNLFPKILAVTVPYTLAIWEPSRWFILMLRKKKKCKQVARQRIAMAAAVLLPYGLLIGFIRVYLENYTNVWGMQISFVWYFMWSAGTTILFICLQIAVYESFYFFKEWGRSLSETEELKRIHLDMQLDSLKVQIQPHFLFNSLNSLVALIEFNPSKAKKFTVELAHMYRYFLEANDRQMINLEDELAFAETYFLLLKTRYDEGLHLEIANAGKTMDYEVPPLSLQLLLENAIKHNIITKARPLYIHVEFDYMNKVVTVRNNLQRKIQLVKTGKGLNHLSKKFELMNLPEVFIEENNEAKEFSVTIPFIKSPEYESTYN